MKKVFISFLFAGGIIAPFAAFGQNANSSTVAELQAKIEALQAQIRTLSVNKQVPPSLGTTLEESKRVLPLSATPALPTSKPIQVPAPVFDDNTSDDDIVQLNNLRIQSISSNSAPAVVMASTDYGMRCVKFMMPESSSGSSFPCPVPSSTLYQIKVDTDTVLLLRTRSRAALSQFAVGDRINVYGFMDPRLQTVDALIVRNLDKPVMTSYIQLNNVEVNSDPGSTVPASFTVVKKIGSPCFDYGNSGVKGTIFPCPLGFEIRESPSVVPGNASGSAGTAPSSAATAEGGAGIGSSAYYPRPSKYIINVNGRTQILRRDRTVMSLDDIEVGDTLNIYGTYQSQAQSIDALVIRDLSKPVSVSLGSLRVTVTDGEVCPYYQKETMAGSVRSSAYPFPCGLIYNATVELYKDATLVGSQYTDRGVASFDNLNSGTYTLVVSAPGYERYKESIGVSRKQAQEVIIPLSKISTGPISVLTRSKLAAQVGESFSAMFYGSGGKPFYAWSVTAGALPPGLSLIPPPMPMMPCIESMPCPVYKETQIMVQGTPTVAGSYKFTLTAKDELGNTGSGTFVVTVGNTTMIPRITLIDPQSGPVGTQVTLTGTGFTPVKSGGCEGNTYPYACDPYLVGTNTINFGPVKIENVTSGGKTITFTVPDSYMPPCPAGMGCVQVMSQIKPGAYNVSVSNANGTSNNVLFTVTSSKPNLSIQVLSPNGGETWTKGTTQMITWRDNTPYPVCPTGAQCAPAAPKYYDIKLAFYNPPCIETCPMHPARAPYTIAKSIYGSSYNSYNWSVGRVLETFGFGDSVPDGSYTVQICQSGTSVCDSSDSYFKIVDGGVNAKIPVVSSISPASGQVGTVVTLKGLGFTEKNNTVIFGSGYINYLASADRITLSFTIPEGLDLCKPGVEICSNAYPRVTESSYRVGVMNENGTSNYLSFTVTPRTVY